MTGQYPVPAQPTPPDAINRHEGERSLADLLDGRNPVLLLVEVQGENVGALKLRPDPPPP